MTQQVGSITDRQAVVLDLTVEHSEQAQSEAAGRTADDAAFRADVLAGLARTPKSSPSQYLYDTIGAKLFERITEQPEYYPTRTEIDLLREHAASIAAAIGPHATIVEPGSGAGEKVEILLRALDRPRGMVPGDIAREQLRSVARTLSSRHPGLKIAPLWADFTQPIELPPAIAELHPRLVFFPGSTIGNFMPDMQRRLLRSLAELAGQDGALLIGFDRIKDETILIPAYDDPAGVTREFELNILTRMNRELDAKFDLSKFRYEARWNAGDARIEMYLVATEAHQVMVAGELIEFAQGEAIWNESSHKYDDARIDGLAASAGLTVDRSWSDERGWFTLALLRHKT
ncbi:MAG: L-histidine N(alpha)-methyltransferase [Phycisphaerales bacterium]